MYCLIRKLRGLWDPADNEKHLTISLFLPLQNNESWTIYSCWKYKKTTNRYHLICTGTLSAHPPQPPPHTYLHNLLEYLPEKEMPILGKIYPFFCQTTIPYCADYPKKLAFFFLLLFITLLQTNSLLYWNTEYSIKVSLHYFAFFFLLKFIR